MQLVAAGVVPSGPALVRAVTHKSHASIAGNQRRRLPSAGDKLVAPTPQPLVHASIANEPSMVPSSSHVTAASGASPARHNRRELWGFSHSHFPHQHAPHRHTPLQHMIIVQPGAGTLQAALDDPSCGVSCELVLADGVYTGSGTNVLDIAKSITIRAQNAGLAVLDGEDARRVVSITAGPVVLDGLHITRGRVRRPSSPAALRFVPLSSIAPMDLPYLASAGRVAVLQLRVAQ